MINNAPYSNPDYSFKTISDFKWAMNCGTKFNLFVRVRHIAFSPNL